MEGEAFTRVFCMESGLYTSMIYPRSSIFSIYRETLSKLNFETHNRDTHLHWGNSALIVVHRVGALHGRREHRGAVDGDGAVDVLGAGHLDLQQESHILLTSRLLVDLKPESKTRKAEMERAANESDRAQMGAFKAPHSPGSPERPWRTSRRPRADLRCSLETFSSSNKRSTG